MATTEPGQQGLRTFGRFVLIVIVAWAVLLGGLWMSAPYEFLQGSLYNRGWTPVLPQAIDTVTSTLGIALILLGVLRVMRMLATASPPVPTAIVLPAVIILAGATLLDRGWGAPLSLAVVVAASVLAGRPWRQTAADSTTSDAPGK